MKANELRIGNHIRYRNEIIEVQSTDILSAELSPSDFSAIILTEEWLLKFGFKRFPWGLVVGNLLFKDNLKCTELTFEVGNGFRVEIKYIHQLQNLYFALTGEELTLK